MLVVFSKPSFERISREANRIRMGPVLMAALLWRQHVAEQLIEAAQALSAGNARRASAALGTAVAYLEKARASGDPSASALLLQLSVPAEVESTERFSFAPGELEQLNARRSGS